jgi:hypothetical protein
VVRRLLRLGVRVQPDRAVFRVHDRGADPVGMQAPALPQGGELVSVGYDQMWIASLQDDVEVTVLLEEWEGEPPPGRGGWEQEVVQELYLRGSVAVSTATAEPVLYGVRLRSGVGRYRARIRAQHRTEIARLYDALLDRFRDGLSAEFQAALRELEGVEHYLIQLWPSDTASGAHRTVSESALALTGALPAPPRPPSPIEAPLSPVLPPVQPLTPAALVPAAAQPPPGPMILPLQVEPPDVPAAEAIPAAVAAPEVPVPAAEEEPPAPADERPEPPPAPAVLPLEVEPPSPVEEEPADAQESAKLSEPAEPAEPAEPVEVTPEDPQDSDGAVARAPQPG